MTEPLSDEEKVRLLESVGYEPSIDEAPPAPTKTKRKEKHTEPDVVTASDKMHDNTWQDAQFQARKAIVGKGFTKEEAADHNKKLWKALGDERAAHNKEVRAAQRALTGTGVLKDVITASRDHAETVDDLVRALREMPPELREEALKRLG